MSIARSYVAGVLQEVETPGWWRQRETAKLGEEVVRGIVDLARWPTCDPCPSRPARRPVSCWAQVPVPPVPPAMRAYALALLWRQMRGGRRVWRLRLVTPPGAWDRGVRSSSTNWTPM